jgi:hypothetical protein
MKLPTILPTSSVFAADCPYHRRRTWVFGSGPTMFPSQPMRNTFSFGYCESKIIIIIIIINGNVKILKKATIYMDYRCEDGQMLASEEATSVPLDSDELPLSE